MVLIKFFMMMALMFAMTFHSIAPAHANSDQDKKIQAAFLMPLVIWSDDNESTFF